MKVNKAMSIEGLSKLVEKPTDEVLLQLWDVGMDYILDANTLLIGQKLMLAKSILGIPNSSQLQSLKYWQSVLGIDEVALRNLLIELGVPMSVNARKLPTGAIRKLKSETKRRNAKLKVIEKEKLFPEIPIKYDLVNWVTVGKKENVTISISVKEIIDIHNALVQDFSNHLDPIYPAGVRDMTLLESAVYRVETSLGADCKYESIEMKGAALLHSMIHNHPFHNGNKRTALVTLLVYLDACRRTLTCTQDELFKFVLNVAQHRIVKGKYLDLADREVIEIAKWIYNNSRQIRVGDRVYPFRRIRPILVSYGCQISHSGKGTNYKMTRSFWSGGFFGKTKSLTTNVSIPNEGSDLEIRTIKKIREDLQLDEANGIDSEAFYNNTGTSVDEFIIRYQKTLMRLSKL
jgi:death-on-curing family protein